jgi:hypothetical protein
VYTLDEKEAFEAMTRFLTAFYKRTGGDMDTLIADIEIQDDGVTNDPAAWSDWMQYVAEVKNESAAT